MGIHKAAYREDRQPADDNQSGIGAFHQHRYQRNDRELGQAGPGQNEADLFGVIAKHLAKILREDINRAVKSETDKKIRERAQTEIAIFQ
jgi:hypothetical protein